MTKARKPDVRLVHSSDLHLEELGDRRCQGLTHVVDFALEQEADGLLIAGDFFDTNRVRMEVIEFAVAELARFGKGVVVAAGNHDCAVPESVYNRGPWAAPGNIHVLREADGETVEWDHLAMTVWGKPLTDYGDGAGPLEGMPRPRGNGRWQVAIAHGYFQPPGARTWASFPMTAAQIAKSRRHYIALGDSHAFKQVAGDGPVTAYYSGAPSSGTHTVALARFDGNSGGVAVECHSLRERFSRG